MEEPQRRICRVVQTFTRAVGKHVGDQPVAHVMAERAEDVTSLTIATGRQRQPLEADHRVAAPVGEPVIPGNHRADVLAGGLRARRLLGASCRSDHELIGGEHEFLRQTVVRRTGNLQQVTTAFDFCLSGMLRRERLDRLPRFRSTQSASPAPVRSDPHGNTLDSTAIRPTRSLCSFSIAYGTFAAPTSSSVSAARSPCSRSRSAGSPGPTEISYWFLIAVDRIWQRRRFAHGGLVRSKMNRRPQRQADRAIAAEQSIGHLRGVLPVRHEQALLDSRAAEVVDPDRQPEVQPEFDQLTTAVGNVRTGDLVFVAKPHDAATLQPRALEEMIEHHHPAERRGQ